MIRVLHIINEMENAGIEHFIMEHYRNIDRDKIQFDFLLSTEKKGYFEDEIIEKGGKVFHICSKKRNPFKNFYQTKQIIKNNNYKIVHRHGGNVIAKIDLLVAKFAKADKLIFHAHRDFAEHMLLHYISRILLKFPVIQLACSEDSGKFCYGKNSSFVVIPNAINLEKFFYNIAAREEYRTKMGLGSSKTIIFVGRLAIEKNILFLIDTFFEVQKEIDSKLLIVGNGNLKDEIIKRIDYLGIKDKILLFGNRNDVHNLLSSSDLFVLPSLYEGLPISMVEAQINGLQCFVSDSITKETCFTNNVDYLQLDKELWKNRIIDYFKNNLERKDDVDNEEINNCKYNINSSVKLLERIYLDGSAK